MVYSICTPTTTIVGQSPGGDLVWLGLKQGLHYNTVVDISLFFSTYNERYKSTMKYSLQNTAAALLKMDMAGAHSAKNDSIAAVSLYNLWIGSNENQKKDMLRTLETTQHPPSVTKAHNHMIDGVCMTHKPKLCWCKEK